MRGKGRTGVGKRNGHGSRISRGKRTNPTGESGARQCKVNEGEGGQSRTGERDQAGQARGELRAQVVRATW